MKFYNIFDVIIVGGGHAGIEAALISSKMGSKTLLLTNNIETLGQMSCNPSIGGIGKSHLVKEIDSIGGFMGICTDKSAIQFRILNLSKGAAVHSTRAQVDKNIYKFLIKLKLERQKNLYLFQENVNDLIIKNYRVLGVITTSNIIFKSKTIILSTGTFLNSKIFIGKNNYYNNQSSNFLTKKLEDLGLIKGRLKTGTPPRIDKRTINFSILKKQQGEISPIPYFSLLSNSNSNSNSNNNLSQIFCWITKTNNKTHEIIKNNIKKSSIYNGNIKSLGPRYCPSIEEKIIKFKNKKFHQIYLEPEGLLTNEIYPNGISTSLPFKIQKKIIRSIKGLENAFIIRFGYAIEYDYFIPNHLKYTLESKLIKGLFFAGQINGTTGYEEAAAQGIISGLNASLFAKNNDSWYPKRYESYIGVLIDDLITQNINEPYRIFTSKSEYRLNLREDNVNIRLTKFAKKIGSINKKYWKFFKKKKKNINLKIKKLKKIFINNKNKNFFYLLKFSNIYIKNVIKFNKNYLLNFHIYKEIEINIKYKGYIKKQKNEIKNKMIYENLKLPINLNYLEISSISIESRYKLMKYKPETFGQASRLLGITPATLSVLLLYLKKKKYI